MVRPEIGGGDISQIYPQEQKGDLLAGLNKIG